MDWTAWPRSAPPVSSDAKEPVVRLHGDDELPVWRSMMFVPVNVPRYVAKAHTRGADAIILDLEDSVAPADKAAARGLVADAARTCGQAGADITVRINRPLELAVRDLEAVVSAAVTAVLLPKVDSAAHVRLLAEVAESVERQRGLVPGHTRFMLLVETPEALARAGAIARAHPRNVALSLGAEDFAAATGSVPDPDVLLFPKQQIVFAARAAGILPMGVIGTVADYQDVAGYPEVVRRSRRFGFQGATCIHPGLVPVLNEGFSPTAADVAAAERTIAAYEQAQAAGRGSIELDGTMIDVPVVERAQRLVTTARRIAARRGSPPPRPGRDTGGAR
jgi:citrate lyase subunit beta/citryl-CoA lyase